MSIQIDKTHDKKRKFMTFEDMEKDDLNLEKKEHKKVFLERKYRRKLSSRNSSNKSNSTNFTVPRGAILSSNNTGIPINKTGIYPTNTKFLQNDYLDIEMKDTYQSYTKCKVKTGLLYNIKVSDYKEPSTGEVTKMIYAKPCLTSISENSFMIQENQTPQSLIQALMLEKIIRVTQTYKGTNCFDVVEEKKETQPIQLCAESKEEMDQWIMGILEFKECLLKDKLEVIDANANAFTVKRDNKKIEEEIREGKGVIPEVPVATNKLSLPTVLNKVKREIPDALFYTNTFAPTKETKEVEETDETLARIMNDKAREELSQRQIKREVEDKIRKVKEAHDKILLQEKILSKQKARDKKKELAAATNKIEEKTNSLQKKILAEALMKMQTMNVSIIFKIEK
jgi:hypothetical protein